MSKPSSIALHRAPGPAGPVPREAIRYFRRKRIRPGFDYRDVWEEEHAAAFTVAGLLEEAVLKDVQEELTAALAGGVPFEEFQKRIAPRLGERGWLRAREVEDPDSGERKVVELGTAHRLRTIFDTNVRQARHVGQWQRIERTKRVMPYLAYQNGPSKEHRPEHVEWAGTVLPVDHPWWDTHMPVNGWGCKCSVRQVSRREAERLGITKDDAIDERSEDYRNKRTGAVTRVPRGIDPGFAHNPGKGPRERVVAEAMPRENYAQVEVRGGERLRAARQAMRLEHLHDRAFVAELARLSGLPGEGADVTVSFPDPDLVGSLAHVSATSRSGASAVRQVARDASGANVVKAVFFEAPRGKPKNYGVQAFTRMVEAAHRLNASHVAVIAARFDDDDPEEAMVGYMAWARMGYDMALPRPLRERLTLRLRGARLLSDLMATEAGRAWWRENGEDWAGAFDVAPNSEHRLDLAAYRREKGLDP